MMTVYKMHGMAYDYLAAVDEENKRIWVLLDGYIDGRYTDVKATRREDVEDCSSWTQFDVDTFFDSKPRSRKEAAEVWDAMMDDIVFEHGTADIMEKWDDMDV